MPVTPHRAFQAFQPPHQRVAGDLEKARVIAEAKEGAVKQVVAGRVAMPADDVRQLDKAAGHAQRRIGRVGGSVRSSFEKSSAWESAAGKETDCFRPNGLRRRSAGGRAKALEIDVAGESNDFHGPPST